MELEQRRPQVTVGAILHRCDPQVNDPITATFSYRLDDPAAVHATFAGTYNSAHWRFGRNLLDDAFASPDVVQGQGDVQTCYLSENTVLRITLFAPADSVDIFVDAEPLAVFTNQIFALVPFGKDTVDVDAMLRDLGVQG